MRILALLVLCISCWGRGQVDAAGHLRRVSSGGVVYASAPEERGAYAVGGSKGQSHYGYNTGTGIAKVEVRQPSGTVVGSYRYFDPNGKQVVRSYIADDNGFRVLGNDLPISPDTPASKVLGAPALTGAFEGTTDFDIPPPLTTSSQSHHQLPHVNQRLSEGPSRIDTFLDQRQKNFEEQHRQLEQQREALRVQQEKLEALQRQIDEQQRTIYQPDPVQSQIISQPSQTSTIYSSSFQKHHPYHRTTNQLTGGYTSPYFYSQDHLNYDFPAGFAYHGLPVTRVQPQPTRRGCYYGSDEPGCGSSYIIGRAR